MAAEEAGEATEEGSLRLMMNKETKSRMKKKKRNPKKNLKIRVMMTMRTKKKKKEINSRQSLRKIKMKTRNQLQEEVEGTISQMMMEITKMSKNLKNNPPKKSMKATGMKMMIKSLLKRRNHQKRKNKNLTGTMNQLLTPSQPEDRFRTVVKYRWSRKIS